MVHFERQYQSVPESEEVMLDDLKKVLVSAAVRDPLRFRFMLAVSEAFTNALVHGNGKDPSKRVFLVVDINSERLLADVSDEGKRGLEAIPGRRPADLLAENGRGIPLIRHYAQEVKFAETGTGGLKVCLRFDRSTRIAKNSFI